MSASPYVQEFRARKLRGVVLPLLCWLLVAGFAVVTGNALVDGLSDGTRSETGVMDWVLVVVPLLVALPWAWSMFDGIGRSVQLGGFDPESATERCTLTVREYGTRRQGKVTYLRAVGVVSSSNARHESLAPGREVALETFPDTMPDPRRLPPHLEARVVSEGALSTWVLVRGVGTPDWWAADTAAATPAQTA
jgi:hypothetical protein